MSGYAGISAVVITCNDAEVLAPCLDSVASWVDEIVVVDMHSTDGTREIASRYTERLYDHARLPYADPARDYAFSLAAREWVLFLDPDERVLPALAEELRRVSVAEQHDVVVVPFLQVAFGRRLMSPGGQDSPHVRFFRRGTISWPEEIHGGPSLSGLRCLDLSEAVDWRARDLAILHETWRSPHQVLDKLARYIPKDAERRLAQGGRFTFPGVIWATYVQFRDRFVVGRAYEDGVPGFFHAALFAVMELGVYAEMWHQTGRSEREDVVVARWGRRLAASRKGLSPVRVGLRAARGARRLRRALARTAGD
jgi:(heptosyl)LPS beta-1,4-glucosyltransferase